MKKLIAVLMAIAMIAALSVTAFAAANIEDVVLTNPSVTVSGTYNAGGDENAYKVTLDWDAMEYDYYAAADRTWDPEQLDWTVNEEAGWKLTAGSNEITVTNASNVGITATFAFAPATGYEAVTGSFTDAEDGALAGGALPVPAATVGNAGTATAKFVIGGTLVEDAATLTQIGSISVELS